MDIYHDGTRLPVDEPQDNFEPEKCPRCDGTGMVNEQKITELGCAGHLIVSNRCRWKRHTQVGNFRISTIGDYYYDGKRQSLDYPANLYFETMVFKTLNEQEEGNEGCGCMQVVSFSELDGERYATAGEAQQGHEKYINKYRRNSCPACKGTGYVQDDEIPY